MRKFAFVKLTVVVLVVFMLVQVVSYSVGTLNEDLEMGDVNCDGEINTGDSLLLLKYTLDLADLSFYGKLAADVNADGQINTGDASTILAYCVNPTLNFTAEPLNVVTDSPISYSDILYSSLKIGKHYTLILCEYTAFTVIDPMGNVCYAIGYSMKLPANTTVVLETTFFDDVSLDTRMYMLDDNLNMFYTDDNGGDAKFSRIEYTTVESGTYHVLVCSRNIDSVGICQLYASDGDDLTPSPTPTEAIDTPKPPMPTPTSTSTPTPTIPPSTVATLSSSSLPKDGSIVQFLSPYSLQGVVLSNEPITSLRLGVFDSATGKVELMAKKTFRESDNVRSLSLTEGGGESIDNQISFSALSLGAKNIVLSCNTSEHGEIVLYSADFYVGATDSMLNGNTYNSGASPLGTSARTAIIKHLNSLDPSKKQNIAIMHAVTYLGTPYGINNGQMDCSLTTLNAYRNVGISLPRTAAQQGEFCYKLNGEYSRAQIIPGDLVFFTDNYCTCGRWREIHHVALYIGTVDSKRYYIEASYALSRVVVRVAWGETPGSRWKISFYGRPYPD